MSLKHRLVMTLASAGVPVDTVTLTSEASVEVTYMPSATPEQIEQGAAIIAAFDWSAQAQAAWDAAEAVRQAEAGRQQLRQAALITLASNDVIPVAVRVFIRDLYTQLNDLRELAGLPRVFEPEILARIVPALAEGLGEMPTTP